MTQKMKLVMALSLLSALNVTAETEGGIIRKAVKKQRAANTEAAVAVSSFGEAAEEEAVPKTDGDEDAAVEVEGDAQIKFASAGNAEGDADEDVKFAKNASWNKAEQSNSARLMEVSSMKARVDKGLTFDNLTDLRVSDESDAVQRASINALTRTAETQMEYNARWFTGKWSSQGDRNVMISTAGAGAEMLGATLKGDRSQFTVESIGLKIGYPIAANLIGNPFFGLAVTLAYSFFKGILGQTDSSKSLEKFREQIMKDVEVMIKRSNIEDDIKTAAAKLTSMIEHLARIQDAFDLEPNNVHEDARDSLKTLEEYMKIEESEFMGVDCWTGSDEEECEIWQQIGGGHVALEFAHFHMNLCSEMVYLFKGEELADLAEATIKESGKKYVDQAVAALKVWKKHRVDLIPRGPDLRRKGKPSYDTDQTRNEHQTVCGAKSMVDPYSGEEFYRGLNKRVKTKNGRYQEFDCRRDICTGKNGFLEKRLELKKSINKEAASLKERIKALRQYVVTVENKGKNFDANWVDDNWDFDEDELIEKDRFSYTYDQDEWQKCYESKHRRRGHARRRRRCTCKSYD